jgi:hypothetical protein
VNPIQEVTLLAKEARVVLDETYNSPDVLPFTSKAIEIIEANPSLKPDFEQAFLEMVDFAPTEFIEICLHIFRWPNIKAELEQRHRDAISRNDWHAEPFYRNYLEAFDPDWDGREFYGL